MGLSGEYFGGMDRWVGHCGNKPPRQWMRGTAKAAGWPPRNRHTQSRCAPPYPHQAPPSVCCSPPWRFIRGPFLFICGACQMSGRGCRWSPARRSRLCRAPPCQCELCLAEVAGWCQVVGRLQSSSQAYCIFLLDKDHSISSLLLGLGPQKVLPLAHPGVLLHRG